jgi:ATP-dependent helicase HrpA
MRRSTVAVVTSPDLPIAAHADELVGLIRGHQVVIVAGETGSGKSTQLPQLCRLAGRGVDRMIGHTQPRRVAARAIADRVADELGVEVGGLVGCSVRFDDRIGDDTRIRVMTDGVLLAELQRDRDLGRYDTIIVDEAHERSLNIDVLLGYLKQLLTRRPDLHLVVTSATIDTARFARHFAVDGVDAPVVEVSGRAYPVEVRYRPYGTEPGDERDQVQAVCDAIEELAGEGPGDVLVFLSGEREILDVADAVRELDLRSTEILPLYARLSAGEQHRIFTPHRGRRIVLATNVAETSITVPGVRYVVDAGLARISRYSRRMKVQRLPIEPISRASADQRAGRCGRVAPGICIRLYGEDDYAVRPAFTQPEILRTNLASVVLQLTALRLGDVTSFPFLEPPEPAAVRAGVTLLDELGAIETGRDGELRLTRIGRTLARLPIDPQLGRMVVEAERSGCVREVLVIASALSIQDPRERPLDDRPRADELHRRFDVPGSDLLSIVALWDHLREQQRRLSSNQFRKLCKAEHLHHVRVREWHDLFSQLRRVAGEVGIRPGTDAAHPDHVHRAVLAGLVSHVGMRVGETRTFRGVRGTSFVIGGGSVLARRPPRWVVAAELVETDRLRARRVATIQPEWIEQVAPHLVSRVHGDPWWDATSARAVTTETVSIWGLPIVTGRVVGYDRVDPVDARRLFIRHALVDGEWRTHHRFVARNAAFRDQVDRLEDRVRRRGLLDDDVVEAFFDDRIGPGVVSGRHFDRWWRDLADEHLLDLTDDLVDRGGGLATRFPDQWRAAGHDLRLSYRYEPGEPLDGVTIHVPLVLLGALAPDELDAGVPGHREELVIALMQTLPKEVRRGLVPMAEHAAGVAARVAAHHGAGFLDAVAQGIHDIAGLQVTSDQLVLDRVPAHLRVHVVVHGADGEVVDAGTDVAALQERTARAARRALVAATPLDERRGIVDWDVGTIPRSLQVEIDGVGVTAFPALVDEGDSVSLRILTTEALQARAMRAGVRRLLLLTAAPTPRRGALGSECAAAAVDRIVADEPALPWDADAFERLRDTVRHRAPAIARDAAEAADDIVTAAEHARRLLATITAPSAQTSVVDAEAHLERLVAPGFVVAAGTRRLPDVRRYVDGIVHRLERLEVVRDLRRLDEVRPLEQRWAALRRRPGTAPAAVADIGWQLEELRIATFAQPLGVHGQVSATRVDRALRALGA